MEIQQALSELSRAETESAAASERLRVAVEKVKALLEGQLTPTQAPATAPAEAQGLVTIEGLCEGRSWPTDKAVRWLIHTRPDFDEACVHRVNRRILIDAESFWRWVKNNANLKTAPSGSVKRGRGRPRNA